MHESLTLSQEWDKTFPKSDQVDHCKITFHNRYGIPLAGDLYRPKEGSGRLSTPSGRKTTKPAPMPWGAVWWTPCQRMPPSS